MTSAPNTANPFTPGRIVFLILAPAVAAFWVLVLIFIGPNRYVIFEWDSSGQTSDAVYDHWCDELRMQQVTPELQAHVDAQRALPWVIQICGK